MLDRSYRREATITSAALPPAEDRRTSSSGFDPGRIEQAWDRDEMPCWSQTPAHRRWVLQPGKKRCPRCEDPRCWQANHPRPFQFEMRDDRPAPESPDETRCRTLRARHVRRAWHVEL